MSDPIPWTFGAGGVVVEQLEWLTDGLAAETGPVQTRRLRETPLTILRFEGQESGKARMRLETLLWHAGSGLWLAPLVMDARRLAAEAALDDDSLIIDGDAVRFEPQTRLLLQADDPARFEVLEIQSVVGGVIDLSELVAGAWPAGTRVVPLREARLLQVPQLARFTSDDTALYQVQFLLDEPLAWPADAGATSYRDYPVLTWRPVWTGDPTWVPNRTTTPVDARVSAPLQVDRVNAPRPMEALQFALVGLGEIAAFRSLLYALAGRWTPIWVPSWAADLAVVSSVANGSSVIDVRGPLVSLFPLASNRRDLRIELQDGTVLYRRINSVAALSPTVDRLTLDAPFSTGFSVSAVALVSYMALSRQASDVNALRYFDWQTVECELVFEADIHGL